MSEALKTLCSKIGSGSTPTGGSNVYLDEGTSFVRSQNVEDFYFIYSGLAKISDAHAAELDGVEVQSGDILFNITGDSIARCTIIPDEALPARVSQHVSIIRATEKINNKYLLLYLQFMKEHLLTISRIGGTRNAITKDMLGDLVPIRNKNEKGIADTIFAIMRKIEVNNAINAELERLAKTIYEYWFVQFDFPNAEGKPYKSSGGAMEYNPTLKREVPKWWRLDKLENKITFERGNEPGTEAYSESRTETHTTPFIRVSDMGEVPKLYIAETATAGKGCNANDVMVSFDGTVGKVAIAMQGCYSTGIRKIKAMDADYTDGLIYFIFQSELIQKTISKYATGSNILHAGASIEHLYFAFDSKTVERYNAIVEPIFKQLVSNRLQNLELAALRDFLLPLLMNGQVTVRSLE